MRTIVPCKICHEHPCVCLPRKNTLSKWVFRAISCYITFELVYCIVTKNYEASGGYSLALLGWIIVGVSNETYNDLLRVALEQSASLGRMAAEIVRLRSLLNKE